MGFKSREELYSTGCEFFIKGIKIPTLFIHSQDDPICVPECVPIKDINDNPYCMMVYTPNGGHVEFFEGNSKVERWIYKPVLEFLEY